MTYYFEKVFLRISYLKFLKLTFKVYKYDFDNY